MPGGKGPDIRPPKHDASSQANPHFASVSSLEAKEEPFLTVGVAFDLTASPAGRPGACPTGWTCEGGAALSADGDGAMALSLPAGASATSKIFSLTSDASRLRVLRQGAAGGLLELFLVQGFELACATGGGAPAAACDAAPAAGKPVYLVLSGGGGGMRARGVEVRNATGRAVDAGQSGDGKKPASEVSFKLGSGVLSAALANDKGDVQVRGLRSPLRIRLALTPGGDAEQRANCSYFDESAQAWAFGGRVVARDATHIQCEFEHLTDFGAVFAPPRFNKPNFAGLFSKGFSENNPVGFYFAIGCLVIIGVTGVLSIVEYIIVARPLLLMRMDELADSDYAKFELEQKVQAKLDVGEERPLSIFEKLYMQVRSKWAPGAIVFYVKGDPNLRTQRLILIEATLLASLAVASVFVKTSQACFCKCALNDTRSFNVTAFTLGENAPSTCVAPCEASCPGEEAALAYEEKNQMEQWITSASICYSPAPPC